MKNKKLLLLWTAIGAVVGAVVATLAARLKSYAGLDIPFLAMDQAALAHHRYALTAIPWVLFSAYWEFAAKNAAAAKSAESKVSRGLHVFLANFALVLEVAPIRGLGRFLPASTLTLVAGLTLETMGLFLTIWARRVLGRNWSGEISIKVDHQLIRSGPYAKLRHPIYTGLLVMYAGAAAAMGSWLAVIGLALAVFAYWRKIRLEEANLRVAFGAEYEAYRRESWALVPGLY